MTKSVEEILQEFSQSSVLKSTDVMTDSPVSKQAEKNANATRSLLLPKENIDLLTNPTTLSDEILHDLENEKNCIDQTLKEILQRPNRTTGALPSAVFSTCQPTYVSHKPGTFIRT